MSQMANQQDSESRHSNISVDPLHGDHDGSGTVTPFKHQYSLESQSNKQLSRPIAASLSAERRHSVDSGKPPNQHLEANSSDHNLAYLTHPVLSTETNRATALISVEQHQSAVEGLVNQAERLQIDKKVTEQERDSLQTERNELHGDKVKMRDQATQVFETAKSMSMELKEKDETLKNLRDSGRSINRRYSLLETDYEKLLQENNELKDKLRNRDSNRCSSCNEVRRQLDDEIREKESIRLDNEHVKTVNRALQDEVESLKKQLDTEQRRKRK